MPFAVYASPPMAVMVPLTEDNSTTGSQEASSSAISGAAGDAGGAGDVGGAGGAPSRVLEPAYLVRPQARPEGRRPARQPAGHAGALGALVFDGNTRIHFQFPRIHIVGMQPCGAS